MSDFDPISFVAKASTEVVHRIRQHHGVHIVYHGDVDGACAAASLAVTCNKLGIGDVVATPVLTSDFDFSDKPTWMSDANRLLVSVDVNFTSRPGFLAQLEELLGRRLIIIDDHVANEALPVHEALVVNPNWRASRSERAIDFASSLFSYLLLRQIHVVRCDWIAALGLYFDRQLRLYRSVLRDLPSDDEYFSVIQRLSAAYFFRGLNDTGRGHLETALRRGESWPDFKARLFADHELLQRSETAQQEIDRVMRAARFEARRSETRAGTLFLYEIATPALITNIIASRMRSEFPPGLYMAARNDAGKTLFEIRAHDSIVGIDLARTLAMVNRSISLRNFGGHPRAAGGAVDSALFQAFVGELERQL